MIEVVRFQVHYIVIEARLFFITSPQIRKLLKILRLFEAIKLFRGYVV